MSSVLVTARSAAGQDRLVLAEMALEAGQQTDVLPEIGNYLSEVFDLRGARFRIDVKLHGLRTSEVAIQYRCADSEAKVSATAWVFEFLSPGTRGPDMPDKPFCQFRVTHVANRKGLAWSGPLIKTTPERRFRELFSLSLAARIRPCAV